MHPIKTTWTRDNIPHNMVHLIAPDVLAANVLGKEVLYSQILADNAKKGFVALANNGKIVCSRMGRPIERSYETIPEAQIQFWISGHKPMSAPRYNPKPDTGRQYRPRKGA